MKIGLFAPLGNGNATAGVLRTLGREAEARGFESIWVAEHVVLFDEYESQYPYSPDGKFPGGADTGLLEPLTALTYLAAVTDRIRLGTGICLVPQRNPVYTAKQVVDLDALSGGRVDFGVGVGWLAEEFEAVAAPFERRGARCDEYLQVMKTLWTDELSEHHGELYDLPACKMYPKPVQQPHPPIHVGGESAAAPPTVRAGTRSTARRSSSTNRSPDSMRCSPSTVGLARTSSSRSARTSTPRHPTTSRRTGSGVSIASSSCAWRSRRTWSRPASTSSPRTCSSTPDEPTNQRL